MISGMNNQRSRAPAAPAILGYQTATPHEHCDSRKPRQWLLFITIICIVGMSYLARLSMTSMDQESRNEIEAAIVYGETAAVDRAWGNAASKDQKNLALFTAVSSNRADMARWAIQQGANPNCALSFEQTVLHVAAMQGDAEIAAMLISHGADVNMINHRGATPLMVAAANGSREVVYELLASGANSKVKDRTGRTALTIAQANGHHDVARMLKLS